MQSRQSLYMGCFLAFLSVSLGAFGAHGLKNVLSIESLQIFQTASYYMMVHSIGLVLFGIWNEKRGRSLAGFPGLCFILGILFFSGSLFALAFTQNPKWGMITPVGGILFMLGWLSFGYLVFRGGRSE